MRGDEDATGTSGDEPNDLTAEGVGASVAPAAVVKCCHHDHQPGDCEKDATLTYTWPGREQSFVCADHGQSVADVCAAIGLTTVEVTPL